MDIRTFSPKQLDVIMKHSRRTSHFREVQYNSIFKSYLRKVITLQYAEISDHYKIISKIRTFEMDTELRKKIFSGFDMSVKPEQPYPGLFQEAKNPMLSWELETTKTSTFNSRRMMPALPNHLYDPEMSGIGRLKVAFCPWIFNRTYNRREAHIYNFNWRFIMHTCFYIGVIGGGLQGISYGIEYLKTYDKTTKNKFVFQSQNEAMLSRHGSFIRGFVRYSYRWGWRMTALAAVGMTAHEALCVYSLNDKPSYYISSAALAGGLYKWTQGPFGMIRSGLISAAVVGIFTSFLSQLHNLRAVKYYCQIDPVVSSPYYYANLSTEQKSHAEKTYSDILRLINVPEVEVTDEIIKQCEVYIGPIDRETDEFGYDKPKASSLIKELLFKLK